MVEPLKFQNGIVIPYHTLLIHAVVVVVVVGGGMIEANSSPPNNAYMRQWIGSALVQIMACRLFGAKLLSKPLLGCYQLAP